MYGNTLDCCVFSDSVTNCLNASEVKKKEKLFSNVPQKGDYSIALLDLQKCLITTASLSVKVRFHSNSCEKEKEEGRERQKGEWGKPSLSALQRI